MEKCAVAQKTPTIEEFFVCFFRIADAWKVTTLPVWGSREWEYVIEILAREIGIRLPFPLHVCRRSADGKPLKIGLREDKKIRKAFEESAIVDRDSGRMWFDKNSNVGLRLHKEYDHIFEELLMLVWTLDNFLAFD